MIKNLSILALTLALGACAYATDTSIQDIRIETPGANNAICHLYIDRLKYKTFPPETIRISKSGKDMEVKCRAPGNRYVELIIESELEREALGNAALGVVPVAWDYASKAIYKYPEVIYVDFTNVPVRGEGMPAHNSPDIRQPEEYKLEEFRPSQPRLSDDPQPIGRSRVYEDYSAPPPDKGDLQDVSDYMFGDGPRTSGSQYSYPGQ